MASSSHAAITIVRTNSNESSGDSADDLADDEGDVIAMTPAAAVAMQTVINTGCIGCNTTSNQSCRKCKKCVCSFCCGQQELENVWCCNACFKMQNVANQQLIRNGNYDSDEEDN